MEDCGSLTIRLKEKVILRAVNLSYASMTGEASGR